MTKRISLIIILICCTFCLNAQKVKVAEEIKGKSNEAIITEMQGLVSYINQIEKLFSHFEIAKGSSVTKEETTKPFALDTTDAIHQLNEAYIADLSLNQSPTQSASKVGIDDHFSRFEMNGNGYTMSFIPKKIFFYDHTVATKDISDLEIDFHFTEDWPFKKRIDSIECEIRLTYYDNYDKVTLNAKNPKTLYKGSPIELLNIDKNLVEFTYNDTLNVFKSEGLNQLGQTLETNSSSTLRYNSENTNVLSKLKSPLIALIKEAQKDTALPSAKFQEKYTQKLQNIFDEMPEESNISHKKMLCEGMVKGVRINIGNSSKMLTKSRMILATTFEDIRSANDNSSTQFYNNDGQIVYTTDKDIAAVNAWFYEEAKSYSYFNLSKKQLEVLPYYSIKNLSNGFVMAQEDAESQYILLDKNNKQLGTFNYIVSNDHTITAYKDNDILIITPSGKQKWLKGIDKLGAFNNGVAFIKTKEKYGFLNKEGEIVIPVIYDGIEEFGDMTTYTSEDNLFAVKKGEKWGFVDINNNVIIPFEYQEVAPFSYGVTMAKKNDSRGLITTKNKVIAPFINGSSYSLSTNFGKRSYSLGTGTYNYLGKKEAE